MKGSLVIILSNSDACLCPPPSRTGQRHAPENGNGYDKNNYIHDYGWPIERHADSAGVVGNKMRFFCVLHNRTFDKRSPECRIIV